MTRPEILFLSHRIPYPPDKGDKIRSWAWLNHFSSRFRVHLACFVDDPRDFVHREFLLTICETVELIPLSPRWSRLKSLRALASGEPLSFHYFNDQRMRAAVASARTRPLAMEFAFSSAMAPFIAAPVGDGKRIVDFCDADSEKWTQYASSAPPAMAQLYAREGRRLAEAETRIANWADASFAISSEEADVFNRRASVNRLVKVLPNGVDADYFAPIASTKAQEKIDVVFTGAMDYRANVDGVMSFVRSVWPLVRASHPEALFAIVGANPVKEVLALDGGNGVTVTGRVDDVRPWLAGAKLVVAPLQVARGVQNKVLEAMAMAKPVVASKEAMTGIAAPSSAAVAESDPRAMADELVALLGDAEKRNNIGDAARAFVLQKFSWQAALATLDAALDELGVYSSSSPANAGESVSSISVKR